MPESVMLKTVLAVHIAGGSIALLSMWIPMVARKGARLHRAAGKVFVWAMATVSITALALAGARLLLDPTARGRSAGLFLLFVSILTGAAVSSGVRVLRAKTRTGPHLHWWDAGLAALLTASSVALAAYGLSNGSVLLTAFSGIGLLTGGSQLAYWLRPPRSPMHWWFEHMSSMLGACIAATTAFLVINAPQWGLGRFSLAAWLAPTVIGTPAIAIWTAYYRRRFQAATARSSTAGTGRRAPAADLCTPTRSA
jgi:uncharacterized membrane protein